MSDEAGFIRAVLASPGDDLARLVYADWLDEQSDPRAEYLRCLCASDDARRTAAERDAASERLWHLRGAFAPKWVRLMRRGRAATLRYHAPKRVRSEALVEDDAGRPRPRRGWANTEVPDADVKRYLRESERRG